jgi:hypothetical protein
VDKLARVFDAVWLEEVGRKVAGVNATAGSDEDLCAAAVGLARLGSWVAAGQARVLAELEARGVCDVEFGLVTGAWLAREAMLPGKVAREQVRVAVTLASSLPEVADALADGRLTWHHGRVLAEACTPRIAEALAELQGELIALAEACSFDRWRGEVRGIVALLDEDGAFDANEDLARNSLRLADTMDGVLAVSGQLVGETALGVREAIEAKADELWRRFRDDHERCEDIAIPPRPTLRALALAELLRAGQAVDIDSTTPARPEVTLVVQAAEGGEASPVERTTGETVDANYQNQPRRRARFRRVYDTGGVRLPDDSVSTLCCDPDIFAVIVDSLGVPLDLGRHRRLASTAQRRAIAVRDGGCCFPGCDLPAHWTDTHHIDPWEHGGRTDVGRLAGLCRRHHGVTHRAGWQMHATDDGWFYWTTPTGHSFWSQRHGRRRRGPTPTAPT